MAHQTPRITISLPCYLRPQRTKRAIESIMSQTAHGWELLITGDKCPNFDREDFKAYLDECSLRATENGNSIVWDNNFVHTGNWGAEIRDQHIQEASGTWFMFMGNDDIITSKHLAYILTLVESTALNFAYFDTWVKPYNAPRNTQMQPGMIGHSELICRTEFLKTMPKHTPHYGHDWTLIDKMMNATYLHQKIRPHEFTYIVMSVKGNEEKGID